MRNYSKSGQSWPPDLSRRIKLIVKARLKTMSYKAMNMAAEFQQEERQNVADQHISLVSHCQMDKL